MHPAILAGLIAFAVAVLMGPGTIRYLRRLRYGQQVRDDGPKSHLTKQGTPTMGGVIIVTALLVGVLLVAPKSDILLYALFTIGGYALVGAMDDMLKIVGRRSLGLKARHKLVGQILIALVPSLYALSVNETALLLPFAEAVWPVHPLLYLTFSVLLIVGFGNAANFTDGLDGLLAGSTVVAGVVYAVISGMAGYPELAALSAAVAGACLGFSWFNAHPAQVFMGDTGSLSLGAALSTVAVLTNTHIILLIVGGLFVVEMASVVLQVAYFRATGGKRIFRMAPIHHHFELSGWAEPKIAVRFWIVAVVCGIVGLMAYWV